MNTLIQKNELKAHEIYNNIFREQQERVKNFPTISTRRDLKKNTLIQKNEFKANDIYNNIFIMQEQYLNKEQQDKIKNSHIALAGLGGIGGYVLESLVRNGFSNIRISDCDTWEMSNYRQLHMTLDTVNVAKIEVVCKHIQSLNPFCNVTKLSEGIKPNNVYEFCKNASIIIQQTDSIAAYVLLKYWASKLRLPYVHGSRKHWLQSNVLTVTFDDFRNQDSIFKLDDEELSKKYGISKELLSEYFVCIEKEINNDKLEKRIQQENALHRRRTILKMLTEQDTDGITHFTGGSRDTERIKEIIKKYPDNFDKLRVSPEQVMIMGAMVSSVVKDIIIGREINIPTLQIH